MALGGISGAWTPDAPSDASNVGLGAGDIRSLKTQIQEPLDSEHIWSAAGGAGMGAHRAGTARAFYGTASQVSSADTDGRFMWTSDTSRLYMVNSATTTPIAGRFVTFSSKNSFNGAAESSSGPTHMHAIESGAVTIPKGTATLTIALQHTWVRGVVLVSHCLAPGVSAFGNMPVSDKSILVSTSSFGMANVLTATGVAGVSTDTYILTYLVHGARVHNGSI